MHFVAFVFDDVQATWERRLRAHGVPYSPARLVVFSDAVDSACGMAAAAVGPFYCPRDAKVYIDVGFFAELHRRFGAPGDFAEAYVIAHEIGHHVQNGAGALGESAGSVDTELQADCYAGLWARDAEERGLLEVGDIDEALGAAAAVGDDTIQERTSGRVRPETWTHGSAAQRAAAFRRGYEHGTVEACADPS